MESEELPVEDIDYETESDGDDNRGRFVGIFFVTCNIASVIFYLAILDEYLSLRLIQK